ncbi:MAG: DUF4397 domain-containing protein [Bacteroidetes bacterium]|nr:DUF4397 domain-containing protein [Bacteroidota bacterium]
MNRTKRFFTLAGGLLLGYLGLNAQTARLQVIHNSADAAADTVDVWLNNTLLIDNFAFRTVWGFNNAPAGVPFDITICGKNSTDTINEVRRFSGLQLTSGETYVAVANGIVSPSGYSPAPAFNLDLYTLGRETASNPANTDILVLHGSTDAPTVDIVAPGVGTPYTNVTLLNDVSYPQFSNYLELPTADYRLQVRTAAGTDVVAEYLAPLQTLNLNGAALVAVASGFLNPAANSNGPAFGIWVAPDTTGPMIQLPSAPISTARAQIIHNCADAAAATVDIWLNDTLYANNLSFREATAWVDVPAGVTFDITICGPNSTDTTAEVVRFSYPGGVPANSKNTIIASGIVVAANYNPAPAFSLEIFSQSREVASNPSNTDVLVYHGATDAPTVDVVAPLVATLVDDISYSEYASGGYLELPTANYNLQVRTASGADVVAEYSAPLQTLSLAGQSITVVASGFLDTQANNNGPAFGLWVALPSGGPLQQLPSVAVSTTRAQVIHNCADAAAALVDVWVNNTPAVTNFAFRTATGFVDLPAGTPFDVTICGPNSTDTTNEVARFTYTLNAGTKYILVASGIVSPTGYNPAPNFTIEVFSGAREEATNVANTDVLVFHGSTDAPTVDVEEAFTGATLVNDAAYTNFAGYLSLPTSNYNISVTDATGNTVVASYFADLAQRNLQGQAITVLASGFLNPSNNSNGPGFGLWVALASGDSLIPLQLTTGITETDAVSNMVMFPNPAQNNVQIAYSLESPVQQGMITLTDMSGRTVQQIDLGSLAAGNYLQDVQLAGLEKGIYIVELLMDGKVSRQRLTISN